VTPDGFAWHPLLNASLNFTSAVLIVLAFVAIKGGDRDKHGRLMKTALGVSVAFLVSYLIRYYVSGDTTYKGDGVWRVVYFVILATHVVLAALVPFLVGGAVYLALKERFAAHRKVVKLAYPIWLYVSVTGIVVYLMLYHFPGQMV
jgi:uncharacterized membrane protein YozB (DUF420 family)